MEKGIYSTEVEQAVIGSLLINNANIDFASDLSANDFYLKQHQLIFSKIKSLLDNGNVADLLTVTESLTESQLNNCGGLAYIAELSKNTPSALNFTHYAAILRNYSLGRNLNNIVRNAITDLKKVIFTETDSSDQLVAKVERELFELGEINQHRQGLSVPQMLDNIIDYLGTENSPFVKTYFDELDKKVGGLEPQQITVVGARPGMGKTAFLISLVCNYLLALHRIHQGEDKKSNLSYKPVFIFSLEMDSLTLMMRILSILSSVPFKNIKNKELDDTQFGKISSAITLLTDFKNVMVIDDDAHLTPSIFRRKLQRYIRLHGSPEFVGIDYVQLMSLGKKTNENRAVEVSAISRQLKIMCKDFDIPLVLLAQLNRAVETRIDKRPAMSDLKESGALEQDATTVILLYRDEVYNEHSEHKGVGELIIAKARNAETGIARVQFHADCMQYRNLVKGYQ